MPSPNTTPDPNKRKAYIGFALIGFMTLAYYAGCGNPDKTETAADRISKFSKVDAYVASQSFVKNKLLSPSTAEFSDNYEQCTTKVNDSTYIVNSFVDAQNGFGATVRNRYMCTMMYNPNTDSISCINVELYQNQ